MGSKTSALPNQITDPELQALQSELRYLDFNGFLTLEDDELQNKDILRAAINLIRSNP